MMAKISHWLSMVLREWCYNSANDPSRYYAALMAYCIFRNMASKPQTALV